MALKLPEKKLKVSYDLRDYVVFLHGPKKIGKSNVVASIPDCYVIITERAGMGVSVFGRRVKTWTQFRKEVKRLAENPGKFPMVAVDNLRKAYDMCMVWVCDRFGVDYPSDAKDRGKTWNRVDAEFQGQMDALVDSGRGLIMTAHSHVKDITRRSGESYDRITPSLGAQASRLVDEMAHMVFYLDYAIVDGVKSRIIVTEGDEHVYAGCGEPSEFPPILPLVKNNGWAVLQKAFEGKYPGIDLGRISIGPETVFLSEDEIDELKTHRKEVKKEKKRVAEKRKVARRAEKRT